jgi:hypothetical protein
MPRKTARSSNPIRQYYKRVPFVLSLLKYVRSFFHNIANKPVRNQLMEFNNLVLRCNYGSALRGSFCGDERFILIE